MRQLVFLALLLTACGNQPHAVGQHEWYNLPVLGNQLVKTMTERASAVNKTVVLNGTEEKREITTTDSLFWATELAKLIQTDLNAPQFSGVIRSETGLADSNSNLKINSYSIAPNVDLPLESCKIFYVDSIPELRKIVLIHSTKNIISSSKGQTIIWLNRYGDQLLIDSTLYSGTDKVFLQGSRDYRVKLCRIPAPVGSMP